MKILLLNRLNKLNNQQKKLFKKKINVKFTQSLNKIFYQFYFIYNKFLIMF